MAECEADVVTTSQRLLVRYIYPSLQCDVNPRMNTVDTSVFRIEYEVMICLFVWAASKLPFEVDPPIVNGCRL
jgi:hypothetical protein